MHPAQGERGRAGSRGGTEGGAFKKPHPDPSLAHEGRRTMANLECGFRRLTFALSVLFASPFLVDGILSFFETGRIHYFLLMPTAIGFVLPWFVFFVARWIAAGFRKE